MRKKENYRHFKHFYMVGVVLLLVIFITGCEDYTVTTVVNPDGSCRRTITVRSDKADLSKDAFPIPFDATWKFSRSDMITKTGSSDTDKPGTPGTDPKNASGVEKTYVYTFEKDFKRVEDMNKEFCDNPVRPPKVKRLVGLEKRFRWFYTFFTYREVCRKLNPFERIPRAEYFSQEENAILDRLINDEEKAKALYPEEKRNAIETKFSSWIVQNVFAEVYAALEQTAASAGVPGLTTALVQAKKNDLLEAFRQKTEIFENLNREHVYSVCAGVLTAVDMQEVRERCGDAFRELEEKLDRWQDIDIFSGFTNEIIMPGLIMGTNAPTVEGPTVSWETKTEKYLLMDYEMWVESRLVNWWAIGIAGFVVLLIVAALVTGTIRALRRSAKSRP